MKLSLQNEYLYANLALMRRIIYPDPCIPLHSKSVIKLYISRFPSHLKSQLPQRSPRDLTPPFCPTNLRIVLFACSFSNLPNSCTFHLIIIITTTRSRPPYFCSAGKSLNWLGVVYELMFPSRYSPRKLRNQFTTPLLNLHLL